MDYLKLQELYHHGIKGQKWGVRNYQNEDGTLTEAGKARYNDDGTPKNAKEMSDEDLQRSIRRLQAENQFNMLSGNPSRNQFTQEEKNKRAKSSALGSFVLIAGLSYLRDAYSFTRDNNGKKVSQTDIDEAKRKAKGNALLLGAIAAFGAAAVSYTRTNNGEPYTSIGKK